MNNSYDTNWSTKINEQTNEDLKVGRGTGSVGLSGEQENVIGENVIKIHFLHV